MTDILNIEEACDFLRVSRSTIYKMANTGKIPALKIGKEWRFPREMLDNWIKQQIELAQNQNSESTQISQSEVNEKSKSIET